MNYIYRLLVALIASGLVFLYAVQADASAPAVLYAAAAFAVTGLIVFLDKIFKLNNEVLFCISIGGLIGLLAGAAVSDVLAPVLKAKNLASAGILVYVFPAVFFGYVGALFSQAPGLKIFGGGGAGGYRQDEEGSQSREKILDTSVIIDGRILDIAETHFIDGPFIIPNFVLREIQLISDSPDPIKRNRGRRGLEMLNKLQQHGTVKVKISYIDYTDTREVDAKLVKLSRETGGKLVTNDFNLNKVAELQGVEVLNLNNLTNALKPVVLPGEDILIDVIKEGKDENQGIGYLEDGTMVVIENGGNLLGKTVKVNVTSIIQTAAGKMIFTRATGTVEDDGSGSSHGDRESSGRGGRNGSRRGRGRNRGGNNSGDGGENRKERGDRGERNDKGDRNEKSDRGDRNERGGGDREDRGDRGDKEVAQGGGGRRRR